jgi:hypothetical protein
MTCFLWVFHYRLMMASQKKLKNVASNNMRITAQQIFGLWCSEFPHYINTLRAGDADLRF